MFIHYLFTDFKFFIWIIVISIVSLSVNMWAQCLIAYWQGDRQLKERGYLVLNPLKLLGIPSLFFLLIAGIGWSSAPIHSDDFRHKYGVAMVSGAGILALLFIMSISDISRFLLVATFEEPASPVVLNSLKFLKLVSLINAGLFIVNILPIPPLGGYRIINNLFPFTGRLYEPLEKYSLILLMLLIFFPGSMDLLWESATTLSHENLMFWSRLLSV